MSKEVLFDFKGVSLEVGSTQILKDLNFQVNPGEFLVILGASGAGKSSILRMFNKLSSPSDGSITFRDRPAHIDIQALRASVGILFQNPVAFSGTVKENLLIAGRWNHRISQLLDHELRDALDQVGLEEIQLDQNAQDLSGGEQQRLALATTLLNHPQVLLLDEPTSSLDPKMSLAILNVVEKLRKSLDLTVIAVSHDQALMKKFATRVILLAKGRLIAEGTFQSLEEQDAFNSAGLLSEEADHEA